MKKIIVFLIFFSFLFLFKNKILTLQVKAENSLRKIVVFQDWFVNEKAKEKVIEKFGGIKIKKLDLINGTAVYLPSKAAERALRERPEVLRVDEDLIIEALGKPEKPAKPTPTPSSETIPWGVDLIEADLVWGENTGEGIKVAILDTGIDLDHPDLKDNIFGGFNTINPRKSPDDDNGHGTHVAGTVAAVNNKIGVIGVGPKISLYAVKVLDRRGYGYLSDIIEGLEWCINNQIQVINMSLGTSAYNQSFEEAIKKVNKEGIVQVAAAGNNGPDDDSVTYPAKFNEVIAVSAIDQEKTIGSFSSRGKEIDLAAPGVDILSTYKDSTYKTASGTSMAAPHVTGVCALVLKAKTCGECKPLDVQEKLETTANDLGEIGKDSLYGAGLVNASEAVKTN